MRKFYAPLSCIPWHLPRLLELANRSVKFTLRFRGSKSARKFYAPFSFVYAVAFCPGSEYVQPGVPSKVIRFLDNDKSETGVEKQLDHLNERADERAAEGA